MQIVHVRFSEMGVDVLLPVVYSCDYVDDLVTQQTGQGYISQAWAELGDSFAQIRIERVFWVGEDAISREEFLVTQVQRVACCIKVLPTGINQLCSGTLHHIIAMITLTRSPSSSDTLRSLANVSIITLKPKGSVTKRTQLVRSASERYYLLDAESMHVHSGIITRQSLTKAPN